MRIDSRKLKKAILELINDVEKIERKNNGGEHLRGTGAVVGKVGNFYISIEVDEFTCDDLAMFTEAIKD